MAGAWSQVVVVVRFSPMSDETDFSYEIDAAGGRVRLTIRGTLDDHVLADAFRRIYTDPSYEPGLNEITDCREVTEFEMTANGVRRLMGVVGELQTAEQPYRVAIVAPADAVFGMARMYELLQDEGLEEVRVFRSMEAAESFVGGGD